MDYDLDPFDGDNTLNVYVPEVVREPETAIEWYEAVVTEIAWQTGRTLFLMQPGPVSFALQALVNRGATPAEAADFMISRLKLIRCE
jgi:hypothetical protein